MPDFTLPVGRADGRRDPLRLRALLAEEPVVLSFFPLAFTGVCATQLCDLRDSLPRLASRGAQAYGFSCDAVPANAAFARELGLPTGIFSDPNRAVVDVIWETETVIGVHRVPRRGWMVVGRDGRLVDLWVADAPGKPWPGSGAIEAALARG